MTMAARKMKPVQMNPKIEQNRIYGLVSLSAVSIPGVTAPYKFGSTGWKMMQPRDYPWTAPKALAGCVASQLDRD